VGTEACASEGALVRTKIQEESKQDSSPRFTQADGYAGTSHFLDDESSRMVNSPARSWNESASSQRTPRIRPSDASPVRSPRPLTKDSSRQDSAYESVRGNHEENPHADPDTQARNLRARERVEILRGRVLRTRRDLHEKREEVHILRERFRNATDKSIRALNEFIARESAGDRAAIAAHLEQVRSSQDLLGPVEDDYDILEDRLNREEDELEQEEARFYTLNNIVLRVLPEDKLDEPLSPLVKPYEPEDIEYANLDLNNEHVKQYLATVAEAGYLREDLDSLEDEQYRRSQELYFRTRHNIPVSEETKAFLFDFPQAHRKLIQQLYDAEDTLYDLHDRCVAEQLFGASEHVYVPRNTLVEEINESINDARDRSPLRIAVLHHNVIAHLQEPNFSDKKDYVNTWMLDWMQDSSLDAWRLKDTIYSRYPQDKKDLDDDQWSELALDFWDRDEAGEFANPKQVLSTLDAVLGWTGSGANGDDSSFTVDLGEVAFDTYIVGREAASYSTQRMGTGLREGEVSSDLGLVIRTSLQRRSSF
jgi:hypothetical protein